MGGRNIVVFVFVVLAALADSKVPTPHQQELKEHYDHLAYIAEFPCHQAKPRVISVYELFPTEETTNKAYFPDVTVLHVCDNSVGCCTSGQMCRVKHTQTVNLPFKITFLEDEGTHKKGSWVIDYRSFYNHTECQCVDPSVCLQEPTAETGHVQ